MAAIKEGNLSVKYDAPFIFAEVNSDIIMWIVRHDGQRQKVTLTNHFGFFSKNDIYLKPEVGF